MKFKKEDFYFQDKINEDWKVIQGYNNYSVSNLGRIKNNKSNLILEQILIGEYLYVWLKSDINKKFKYVRVNRIVAKAFIPNPFNKPCVNHLDYNHSNNNVDNLEWVTHKELRAYEITILKLAFISSWLSTTRKVSTRKKDGNILVHYIF